VVRSYMRLQGWVLALNLLGLALAVLLVAETFRREPMWLRPEKGPSPRQRRWLGIGLVCVTGGGLVAGMNLAGLTELGLLAFGLPILGLVAIIVSVATGPTDDELQRRAQMLGAEDDPRGDSSA